MQMMAATHKIFDYEPYSYFLKDDFVYQSGNMFLYFRSGTCTWRFDGRDRQSYHYSKEDADWHKVFEKMYECCMSTQSSL